MAESNFDNVSPECNIFGQSSHINPHLIIIIQLYPIIWEDLT